MGVIKYKIKTSELFSKLKKEKSVMFRHFFNFTPPAPQGGFLRMSPGFIMSGGVQAKISTYVPNPTI